MVIILAVTAGGVGLRRVGDAHLRAMSVLMRFNAPQTHGFGVRFAQHGVQEELGEAQTPQGPLKFRLYVPQGVPHPGGLVLLHGVHHLGIEDPRLATLARALAATGIEVMTPELQDLADYHVTSRTVDTIGDSAVILSTKMGLPRVGVIGLSFAGGLSLLAAARPEYASRIGFVVAIGAHDDMNRVARFFAANMIERPDGSATTFPAHEYGVLVLAYSHLEDFFSPQDVPAAREALRKWLWEQPDAMQAAEALSPAGRQQLDQLLHHRDLLQPALFREIQRHADEMQAVSPHGQVADLRAPVYLLHGAGDTIIPASETLWLAKDVPQTTLRSVLISPALVHVDMGNGVTITEKWALVDFLAHVVKATDKLGRMKQ
jgi:pimeloyl-ACP methyl ester carboxylesterase